LCFFFLFCSICPKEVLNIKSSGAISKVATIYLLRFSHLSLHFSLTFILWWRE
jgi:hypothetical protein